MGVYYNARLDRLAVGEIVNIYFTHWHFEYIDLDEKFEAWLFCHPNDCGYEYICDL
jgi:hypothetical protein